MAEARDQAAVDRFTERFVQVMVDSGMPRVASRILVALLTADAPRLTAAELSETLKASPAAISGGVRYLTQVSVIHRGREPGTRRDHFSVDDDVFYQTIARRDQVLARWLANLREGAAVLGEDTPAGARFAESTQFFEFIIGEMEGMIARWEAHRRSVSSTPS